MDIELRKPLVVGNWKMHGTLEESIRRVTALQALTSGFSHVDIALAPPFTALYTVSIALAETSILLAAQNIASEDEGPYTGEVSGVFLKEIGCKFVIVGHSERRQHFGETDAIVNQKLQATLRNELTPILCIGETQKEREKKQTFTVLENQLKRAFSDIHVHDFENLVIAYEPVWAIGSGKHATPEQAEEVHHYIRNWLTKFFDGEAGRRTRILYGGSVKPSNAAALMSQSQIDGLLVGGASLDAESFAAIAKFEEKLH